MRIQVASDLHLEFLERRFPDFRVVAPAEADVLVLAGDIHRHDRAADAFRDWPCPVVLLHGNHELYHGVAEQTVESLERTRGAGGAVRFLEKTEWECAGVRFLGCCLWTDYALYGNAPAAMAAAERTLLDHRVIATRQGPFSARDALEAHTQSRAWLEAQLSRPYPGTTVVCTHHAPSPGSIHVSYKDNDLNPCFINDLEYLMPAVDVWIHGHVHNSFDYRVGRTRVVANPRGYALNLGSAATPAELRWENEAFVPDLVIEV